MAQHLPEATLLRIRRLGRMLNRLSAVSPLIAGRIAFRIFCTPRRLPVREEDRAFLATAQSFDFTVEGLRIRGYTWPSEDPQAREVLCLHGWESNSARWKKYIRGLQEAGFCVHAFDAPASGQSDGRMLNLLLYSRVVKQFLAGRRTPYAVVGHSLGGAAAVMSCALHNAPRPDRMVLLGVFAESARVVRDFAAILGVNETVVQTIYREIERRSGMPIGEYSVVQKAALLSEVRGFVLHDLNDEVAPVEEGRRVAGAWNALYHETRGLGHRMQDKKVVDAVVQFILG